MYKRLFFISFALLSAQAETYYHENTYRGAIEATQTAERCIQCLYFLEAPTHYKEAQALLATSQIEDKSLLFRIELGLTLSEVFSRRDITLGKGLGDIFNKFTTNAPHDKINFEALGGVCECESFPEAK